MECQCDLNDELIKYLEKKWIELYQIQSKICEICLLPRKTNKFIRLFDSNRNFCKSCFYAFPNECFNLYSLIPNLSAHLSPEEEIHSNQLKTTHGPKYKDMWVGLTLLNKLSIIKCPKCNSEFEVDSSRKALCINADCKFCFCQNCYSDYHDIEDCEENFLQLRTIELESLVKDDDTNSLIQCPSCRVPCLKSPYDNHIICPNPQCKSGLCYFCAAFSSPIINHGNHFHRPQCNFYMDYKDDEDKYCEKCQQCRKGNKLCKRPKDLRVRGRVAPDEVEI